METPHQIQRIKAIYHLLSELASGNLAFRSDIQGDDAKWNKLSETLNNFAADFHEAILHTEQINPHFSHKLVIQWTFILSKSFLINSFNATIPENFQYNHDYLIHLDFKQLLAPSSLKVWTEIEILILEDTEFQILQDIIFVTGTGKLLPAFCTISRLLYSKLIFVSTVSRILQEPAEQSERCATKETAVIQDLHDYILNHLEEPLPTLKELAVLFDTNDYKLKHGFRELYNTSIYNFYHVERLKRAHAMILQTTVPLKEIALDCGFNSYLNFYKAFKKNFGYAPSDLERPHTHG